MNIPSIQEIFSIKTHTEFEKLALSVFNFQAKNNKVYAEFLSYLKVEPSSVTSIKDLVYLPVSTFKNHKVSCFNEPFEATFTSSGTTNTGNSKHFVKNLNIYEESFIKGFEFFFGSPEKYCFLFLLPSYMERKGSSLIYMCQKLADLSNDDESGFFLNQTDALKNILFNGSRSGKPLVLLGVSFALLDFAEEGIKVQPGSIIIETGGMKGRKKELTRGELHKKLKAGFGVSEIYSEYGMTELLSQAYSFENELFKAPPWMRFSIYDPNDPLSEAPIGSTGGINIIDLANIESCSFIATQDLGKLKQNNTLEILGRFDFSEVRGCNLMVL